MNGTIKALIRLIAMAVMFINSVLVAKGYTPLIDDVNVIIECAVYAIAFVVFLWAWWKNNNITQAAKKAQAFLDAAKQDGLDILDEEGDEYAESE